MAKVTYKEKDLFEVSVPEGCVHHGEEEGWQATGSAAEVECRAFLESQTGSRQKDTML